MILMLNLTSANQKSHNKTIKINEGHFSSASGREQIYFKNELSKNQDKVKLQVAFLHDILDYHRFMQRPGDFLKAKFQDQINLSWMDFLGHGFSSGSRHYFERFSTLCQDTYHYLDEVAFAQKSGVFNFVVAQGFGALVLLRVLQGPDLRKNKLHGVVLVNPLIDPQFIDSKLYNLALDKVPPLLKKLKFPIVDRNKWASDPQLIQYYLSDSLVAKSLGLGPILEIQKNAKKVRRGPFISTMPVLIQTGALDPFCEAEMIKVFSKGLADCASGLHQYHDLFHDLYNDIGGDRALLDVYNWLHEKIS